jgi:hypothetical protein
MISLRFLLAMRWWLLVVFLGSLTMTFYVLTESPPHGEPVSTQAPGGPSTNCITEDGRKCFPSEKATPDANATYRFLGLEIFKEDVAFVISSLTTVLSFIGTTTAFVFNWRKERRQAAREALEMEKLRLENDRLARELEEKHVEPVRRRVKRPS